MASSSFFLLLEHQMPLSCFAAGRGHPLRTVLAGSRISAGLSVAPHSIETTSPSPSFLIGQVTREALLKNNNKKSRKQKAEQGSFSPLEKKKKYVREKPLSLNQITSLNLGYSSSELRSRYVGVKDRTFSESCFLVCWACGSTGL